MKSTLGDCQAGIDQLLKFLERTEHEQQLLTLLSERKKDLTLPEGNLLGQLFSTSTNTKQYIYTVAIVSLYGLIERLVDGLVSGYIVQLSRCTKVFEHLPDDVRNNHLPYSLALADAVIKDKFRTGISNETIIGNLHSCLSAAKDYKLNGPAFSLHRGNVTLARITEMLNGAGVKQHLNRIARTPAFSRYLANCDPERDFGKLTDEESKLLFESISELVERRNEISHGVVQLDSLESIEILKERCAFVRAYAIGLYELLLHEVMRHTAAIGVAQPLGQPIAVFDHRIVCFDVSCNLAIGDLIFSMTSDAVEPIRSSEVLNLQINRIDHKEIKTDSPLQFGVQVDFNAKDQREYYSLPANFL
jgi:hypothetical protein